MPLEDLKGRRVGRLTVIDIAYKRNKKVYWHCKCDCGNECDVVAYSLAHEKTKSCGCLVDESRRSRYKDITGKKFGRLTAIEPTDKRRRNAIIWKCKCDCGNEKFAAIDDLQSGSVLSCGCLRKEMSTGAGIGAKELIRSVYDAAKYDGSNVMMALPDKPINVRNKSGVAGVFWNRGRWQARIRFKGKDYYLGQFDNIDDAAKARRNAEIRLFGAYQINVGETKGEITKDTVIDVLNWMMEHGFAHFTVSEILRNLVDGEE